MPIYEYVCVECHTRHEMLQSYADPPATQCPSCAGALEKVISPAAFHFKGTGWYKTDYASPSSSNGTGANETKKAASSADSKPAADSKKSDAAGSKG